MEFREFLRREESKNESLLDLAKGTWNTFAGGMTAADEVLSKIMGDGTKGRTRRGLRQMGRGLRQLTIGSPQEKPKTAPEPQAQIQAPEIQQLRQPKPQEKQPLVFNVGKDEGLPSDLKRLVGKYRSAKTRGERETLLATMSMKYPRWYDGQIRRARARQGMNRQKA